MRLALSSDPHITVEISVDTLEMINAVSQKPRAADAIIQKAVNLIVQQRFTEDIRHILTYFINKQIQASQTGTLATGESSCSVRWLSVAHSQRSVSPEQVLDVSTWDTPSAISRTRLSI